MQLEAKGTIKYEPGAKKEVTIKAPTVGIEEEIEGVDAIQDLPDLIDLLEGKIKKQVQEGFARPVDVRLGGFSLSCTYFVEPIPNRTLDEFQKEPIKEGAGT